MKLRIKNIRPLIRGSKTWGQSYGGMQSGVRHLMFANVTITRLLCMIAGVLSCASRQDWSELVHSQPAASSWSFHLLQQILFLISFLCSFLSISSGQLLPPPIPGCRLSMFSHTTGLFVTLHSAFFVSSFNTQHTLSYSYRICAKVKDNNRNSQTWTTFSTLIQTSPDHSQAGFNRWRWSKHILQH